MVKKFKSFVEQKDIEDFEDIQTEEIVPSEDSDMPDDTGAIEL